MAKKDTTEKHLSTRDEYNGNAMIRMPKGKPGSGQTFAFGVGKARSVIQLIPAILQFVYEEGTMDDCDTVLRVVDELKKPIKINRKARKESA